MKNTHGIVPAHRQPYAQLNQPAALNDFQPVRQVLCHKVRASAPQGDIQIAPQIFVPDIPAGGSNMVSEDEICMAEMDEYEKQDAITG